MGTNANTSTMEEVCFVTKETLEDVGVGGKVEKESFQQSLSVFIKQVNARINDSFTISQSYSDFLRKTPQR